VVHNILIVDDEFSSTEALSLILGDEGYRVQVASNGRQALDKLDDPAPDLIITDYMMPVMNGAELTRAVRALPAHERTAILMMSGAPESMLRQGGALYDAFLLKPFDIDTLLEQVRRLLTRDTAA
jgi:DNA-binding response OmpR family regulator